MSHETTFRHIINHVATFHDAFLIGNRHQPTGQIGEDECRLRHRLMHEENEEYLEAALEGDLTGVADALGDQLYILCGTILRHGLQDKIVEVFEEIQRSNMSKLDANGRPILREDGKVMKSDLYFKPDIASILSSGHSDDV
jgi:predicted HAD superfamily Cof-like phosphohydrolase